MKLPVEFSICDTDLHLFVINKTYAAKFKFPVSSASCRENRNQRAVSLNWRNLGAACSQLPQDGACDHKVSELQFTKKIRVRLLAFFSPICDKCLQNFVYILKNEFCRTRRQYRRGRASERSNKPQDSKGHGGEKTIGFGRGDPSIPQTGLR
jgi:hypothetical protein